MIGGKRPLAITILGWLYIAIGTVGFTYHFYTLRASGSLLYEGIAIELVRLLAICAGIFLLRGSNWARWLALAWIASHVVLSAFNSWGQLSIHALFCALIAWFLFRPDAARYFRERRMLST